MHQLLDEMLYRLRVFFLYVHFILYDLALGFFSVILQNDSFSFPWALIWYQGVRKQTAYESNIEAGFSVCVVGDDLESQKKVLEF